MAIDSLYFIPPMPDYLKYFNVSQLPMPYMFANSGMGYAPFPFGFTGSYTGTAASQSSSSVNNSSNNSSTQTARVSKEVQRQEIEKQLQELFAYRTQLADVVEVNTNNGTELIQREAYSEKTGYIAEDGKNDGKISWGKKLLNLAKGCTNLVTDMFFDENGHFSLKKTATTLVVGGALAAAAVLIPGAGAALAGLALASGAVTLGAGAVQAGLAKTDEDAEKAWQNIGSGLLQTGLSCLGMKKVGLNASKKLGVDAPKWYRPDQSAKLAFDATKADINTAGGFSNSVKNNFNQMKLSFDKFASEKTGYSHYENKYTNNLDKLKADIPGTDATYRRYADKMAAAYEKVYAAQNEAEYTQAVRNLERYSKLAKAYRSNNTGMSKETVQAFDDMIKISESVAPKNAYAIRTSKFGSGYAEKMAEFDTKINELKTLGNAATEEQKFQLRILTRSKAAYRALYRANSPVKQKEALARFDQIADEALTQMQKARNNPHTTADVMKAYNDLVLTAQQQVANSGLIVETRAADLAKAAKTLSDRMATDADKSEARKLIQRYLTNTPANDNEYIASVDNIISTLKIDKSSVPITERFQDWKSKTWQNAKRPVVKSGKMFNAPVTYVTTTVDRMVYPQSVLTNKGTRVENSQIDAELQKINEKIEQLHSQLIGLV